MIKYIVTNADRFSENEVDIEGLRYSTRGYVGTVSVNDKDYTGEHGSHDYEDEYGFVLIRYGHEDVPECMPEPYEGAVDEVSFMAFASFGEEDVATAEVRLITTVTHHEYGSYFDPPNVETHDEVEVDVYGEERLPDPQDFINYCKKIAYEKGF